MHQLLYHHCPITHSSTAAALRLGKSEGKYLFLALFPCSSLVSRGVTGGTGRHSHAGTNPELPGVTPGAVLPVTCSLC